MSIKGLENETGPNTRAYVKRLEEQLDRTADELLRIKRQLQELGDVNILVGAGGTQGQLQFNDNDSLAGIPEGNANDILISDGPGVPPRFVSVSVPATPPGGSDKQVQWNDGGAFNGLPNGNVSEVLTSRGGSLEPHFAALPAPPATYPPGSPDKSVQIADGGSFAGLPHGNAGDVLTAAGGVASPTWQPVGVAAKGRYSVPIVASSCFPLTTNVYQWGFGAVRTIGGIIRSVWQYEGTGSGNPGDGKCYTNSTNVNNINRLNLSDEDEDGNDMTIATTRINIGDRIIISEQENSDRFGYYFVTGVSDNGSWTQYDLALLDPGGNLRSGRKVTIWFAFETIAFGASPTGGPLIYVPSGWSCEVVRMGLAVEQVKSATVELVVNGAPQGSACNVSLSSQSQNYETVSLPVNDGDRLNFRTQAGEFEVTLGNEQNEQAQVVAWLEFNEN